RACTTSTSAPPCTTAGEPALERRPARPQVNRGRRPALTGNPQLSQVTSDQLWRVCRWYSRTLSITIKYRYRAQIPSITDKVGQVTRVGAVGNRATGQASPRRPPPGHRTGRP